MNDLMLLIGGVVLLLLTLFLLLIYSGLFASVDVKTGAPPIGKAYIAYKDGSGAYKNVGSNFSESTSIAPNLKQIGFYYDDPIKVPEDKLRWAVGAILAEDDEEVDPVIRLAYEKEKYKFMALPRVSASVNCIFPYTTMISIFIAVRRVYPAVMAYVENFGLEAHPYMEVYFGGNIHFMAPLSSQRDFYTPKALESQHDQTGQQGIPDQSESDKITELDGTPQVMESSPPLKQEPSSPTKTQSGEPAEVEQKLTVDQPADQLVDHLADQSVDEPVDQSVDEPVDRSVDEPKDQSVDEPKDQSVDEPKNQSLDQPVDRPVDRSVEAESSSDSDGSFEKVEAESL
ncbi:testis-expressed protein 264-like [Watersipora subatra]|uniref:testis-expressed protein 264-like n=1 Tax=Watersipora subatra TaxID=2589382 RepID=UPI00355BF5BB